VPEVEIKLPADPTFRLPDLDGVAPGVHAQTSPARTHTTTYHDTADLRLTRWGASLRHRSGEGWTVKLPGIERGRALIRPEIPFEGGPGTPPGPAVDLVRGLTRGTSLAPRIRLRTTRRTITLRRDGDALAEVVDDEVSVLEGRRVADRFREVEVEAIGDADGLLEATADRLRAAGAGPPQTTSKVVRALRGRGLDPEVRVPSLDGDSSAGAVVRAALATSVRRMVVHDPIVRMGEEPEGVHQARVAARRLRSDLRTFSALLAPDRTEPLRDRLRELAGRLGRVRDADVLQERLEGLSGQLDAASRAPAADLIARLAGEREAARSELLAGMRSTGYDRLLDDLVAAASDPPLTEAADRPASELLPSLLEAPWKRLRKAVTRTGDEPSDEELHRIRIRAKRFRYAAEAAEPVLGKPAKRAARRAEGLQDVLGQLQDAVVTEGWLRAAAALTDGRQGYAAGRLASMIDSAATEARGRWRKEWKRLRREGPGSWS
jgi:CHAD domain-containing protein